jgi:very-short-patch-repair endonuclease
VKPDYTALCLINFQAAGLPEPIHDPEYRFAPPRQWRFDFAWPDVKVAVEFEGGIWIKGRHTRGRGFENDCEKYNEAAARGWRVYRFTKGMVESGHMRLFLEAKMQR